MTEANRAPVKIGSLDLNYLDSYIILKDVEIASNLHKDENFIYISEVKGYYSIDFDKKIVTLMTVKLMELNFLKMISMNIMMMKKLRYFKIELQKLKKNLKEKKF